MKSLTSQRSLRERMLSMLLVVVMMLGLIPVIGVPSYAAGLTMTNNYINTSLASGGNYIGIYSSPNLTGGSNVSLRGIPVSLSDGTKSWAFCNDHGKSLTSGMTYTQNTAYALPEALKPFLTFFYYHTLVAKDWSDYDNNFATGYLNTIIWLNREGKFTDYNNPAQMQLIAAERELALGQIDSSWAQGASLALYEGIVAEYKAGGYGDFDFYLFNPANGSDQGMITATTKANETDFLVYICLSKADENNNPLDDCTFGIYETSVDAQNGTNKIGDITSSNTTWSHSGPIPINSETATLYVKELTAKSGYQKSEEIKSVSVSATANATQATAAQVGGASFSFKNSKLSPPDGVIVKVDAITGAALAGTHLRIQGNSDAGHYYDKTHITGNKGEIELQWNDPAGDNYIEPGEYTVTEVKASGGYVLDRAQVQQIRFWIDDEDNPQHSGPIVFYNYPEAKITFQKTDATGKGLGGASFLVLKDGLKYTEFTTGDSGRFTLDGLTDGYYTFLETASPAGYLLPFVPMTSIRVDVTQAPAGGYTLSMANYEYPEILIEKRSADTNELLAGATYEVKIDATTLGTFVTNGAGMIVIDYATYGEFLDEGNGQDSWTVTVTELSPPPGYFLADPEDLVQTNELRKGQALSPFVFKNKAYPAIEILKLDSVTGNPVPGAIFDILIDGTYFSSLPSDEDGKIRIDHETYGKYLSKDYDIGHTITVEEKTAPSGYFLAADNLRVQTKEITTGTNLIQFTFENQPLPDIQVTKKDGQTGEVLAGATFLLKSVSTASGATYNKELTTVASGVITFEDVPEGVYHLSEKSPPSGYLSNDTVHTITVTQGCDQLFAFEYRNEKKPSLTIRKVDTITGDPLAGVEFYIEYRLDGSGAYKGLGTYFTNASGLISLKNLDTGWYKVTEVAPPSGYQYHATDGSYKEFHLEGNEDYTVTFRNTPLSALVIRKIDSDTGLPVPGATFQVRYLGGQSGTGGTVIFQGKTTGNGTIVLTGLPAGTYIAEETLPAEGYELSNPSVQTAYLSGKNQDVVELTFANAHKGALVLRKLDSVTGLPLKGAQFKVAYSDGAVIGPANGMYTTDTEGLITIDEALNVGATVVVQEIIAPEGYVLDTSSQTVKIKENTLHALTFYNTPKGSLIIEKRDSVTKQPLAGAQFRVTTSSGEFVAQAGGTISSNGLYTTDANGKIHITGLGPDTYVVTEISAPEGYNLDAPAQTVVVKANDTQTLTFYDSPKSGLQIVKLDKNTKQPIKGAEFTLYKPSGAVVGTYTTDKDGLILIDNLSPGWLKVVETKAPDGYVLDDTPKDVEITSNQFLKLVFENVKLPGLQILKLDEETRRPIAGVEFRVAKMNGEIIGTYRTDSKGVIHLPEIGSGWFTATETKSAKGYMLDDTVHTIEVKDGKTALLTVTNKKTSGIIIHKVDATTGKGIPGVTFLLYDGNNNPLGQYESDQDGYVYIGDGLSEGKYKIRELKPAAGYNGDDQVRTIYLSYGKTTEIKWENSRELGQIIVTKRSASFNETTNLPAGSPLSGAVFEVYSLSGNLVARMVSDAKGIAASQPIPLGVYIVKEVTPPKYYALNPREFVAELRHNGDIVRFEVLDENVTLDVTVQKKSQNQIAQNQMIIWDLFGIANASSAALESFYLHDRLPTDAVRGAKVFTGTWSHNLTYRVTYKTNYSADYRVLASGLSTKTNYELSIHTNVLGLQSGEYVTDIRWEFGTVPAGFQSVTNPKIQAQVLATLPKGYKIINRADVGGLYIGQWITAQTSWTTLIYSDPAPAPELPKTGY